MCIYTYSHYIYIHIHMVMTCILEIIIDLPLGFPINNIISLMTCIVILIIIDGSRIALSARIQNADFGHHYRKWMCI